jgi:hypothetical protein
MNSTDDAIESLIRVTHGASDLRTQHLYRQSLQGLVELAKMEQRAEMAMDGERRGFAHVVH